MNTKKKAALAKRIDETKRKIAALREAKKSAVPSIGVAFLIETELEKASLIMGAKNIVSDLQSQAEKLAKVEADQLMPIIDQLKTTFGTEAAESFYRSSTSAIRELVDQIQKTKDAINDQIMSLENGAAGLPMNDMQMDDSGAEDDLGDDMGDDLGDDMGDDMGDDDLGGEMGGDMAAPDLAPEAPEAPEDDAFADDMGTAAGRARKESAEKFEKAILEWFRRTVKEGHKPSKAASIVAEGFGVDVADVKDIVRETAKVSKK